jgi:large subunit ribosomal protein L25
MAITATISAKEREGRGKGAARSARREGRIPGILYGHGEESVALSVDAIDLKKLVHSISVENTIVDLDLGGSEPYKVLIREPSGTPCATSSCTSILPRGDGREDQVKS